MEWRETRRKENTMLWGKKKKIFGQRDDLIIFPIVRSCPPQQVSLECLKGCILPIYLTYGHEVLFVSEKTP